MPDADDSNVVVTGKRLSVGGPTGGGFTSATVLTYSQEPAPDVFEQDGGGETVVTTTFALINGNLVVHIPGYDFPIKVPAADWGDMSESEKGALIKLLTEFAQSPQLVQFLDHLQSEGVSEIVIHFDTHMHMLDGSERSFPDREAVSQWARADPDGEDTDLQQGTRLIISVDSSEVNTGSRLAELIIHELGHPFYGNSREDEAELITREGTIYDQIFNTPGENETSPQDYYEGTTVIGSHYADNVTGGTANDTLSGLSGNDVLNGGGGNDLVLGGSGMDQLSGGLGDNMVGGGLDADTYLPAVGVGQEYIVELGGVDRVDLSAFGINECSFFRTGDSLTIVAGSTFIVIENQWLAGSKVEQFVFADGTFASSYIEYLVDSVSSDMCYDEDGNQILCSPFGLPIVFDLDGDGIELVSSRRSNVRLDVNGDGMAERLGWVGKDDGILALDRNHNGRIDDFSEISFVHDFRGAATDLEGLYAYDSDGDGFLTRADERFDEFLVWKDTNGNGKSQPHELFTLEDLGIVSIALERYDLKPLNPDEAHNQVLATSAFETADGSQHTIGDVALFVEFATDDCGCHADGYSPRDVSNIQVSNLQFDGLIP
jgi:hypothetical protein